jgi:membrane-associated phospholipid phosphatase
MVVVFWWSVRPVSDRLWLTALLLLIAQPITYAITTLLQQTIHRPRPIIALPLEHYNKQLYDGSASYFAKGGSFPSDHEALLFLLGTFIFTVNRGAGIACMLFGIFYASLRCGIGYHYPSDMLGGAVIAILVATLLLRSRPFFAGLFKQAKTLGPAWTPILTTLVFVYLADQFNSFGFLRSIFRIVFRGSLFH